MEKIVSLIRFSLSKNPEQELMAKIRHFYDLHFLLQDNECFEYLHNDKFKDNFSEFLNHDRELFENPAGWRDKPISKSPVINDFESVWKGLKKRYETELPPLAYSTFIPDVNKIEESMKEIIKVLRVFAE